MNIRDCRGVRILLIAFAMLAHHATSFAQQTAVSGIVTDDSKSVLPGTMVTAVNISTGRETTAVASERGE